MTKWSAFLFAFHRWFYSMMGSFPMIPQLPGGWSHCLAEATAIRTTELASPCSLYRLTVLKLSRFFSRYILPCDLFGILFLGQLYTQRNNVVAYYPLPPIALSQLCWVDVITEILHWNLLLMLLTHFSGHHWLSGMIPAPANSFY